MTHSNDWTVTLHEVNLDSAADGLQPERSEEKWASIDLENYNSSVPDAYITSSRWRLVSADDRQYRSSSVGYSSFPSPDYAFGDTGIAPGECIRGWITFAVTRDAQLTTVKYSPADDDPITCAIG